MTLPEPPMRALAPLLPYAGGREQRSQAPDSFGDRTQAASAAGRAWRQAWARWQLEEDAPQARPFGSDASGFMAQHLAQERFSAGLHIDERKTQAAIYAAAMDGRFAALRPAADMAQAVRILV